MGTERACAVSVRIVNGSALFFSAVGFPEGSGWSRGSPHCHWGWCSITKYLFSAVTVTFLDKQQCNVAVVSSAVSYVVLHNKLL